MQAAATVSFRVEAFRDYQPPVHAVVPLIDGTSLVELVTAFEEKSGFDVAGGYGGIIPQFFKYGPLNRYLMGQFESDSYWARRGGIYVLGCECGEVGCWPLECRVRREPELVIWEHFRQPHRPNRDYSQFGPCIFAVTQYLSAVETLQERLGVGAAGDIS